MGGLYSITTRAVGTTLTANIYNADHQNHVDNDTPQMMDDYSSTAAVMETTADPYPASVISLPTSLSGELERLRYVLQKLHGQSVWEKYPTATRGMILPAVSGTPQQHAAYRESSAKAWGLIGATGALTSVYNISSVVRTASGRYTIFWQRAFATGKYVVVGSTNNDRTFSTWTTGLLATSCKIRIQNAGIYQNDSFYIIAMGRQ